MGAILKNGINYTNDNSPTKTSELVNDSGFITKSVNNLDNYYTKTESYTKSETDAKLAEIEIGELDDVAITTPSDNDVLKYNSTSGKWENGQGGSGGGGHTIEDVDGTDLTQRDTLQFGEGLLAEDDSTNEKTVVALDPMPSEDIDEVVDIYPQAGELVSIVNAFNRGDIYSTDEKMIGQWIDGKPLYQRTFEVGYLVNNGVTQVDITTLMNTVDTVIDLQGIAVNESNKSVRPLCLADGVSSANNIRIDILYENNSYKLRVFTATDWGENTYKVYSTLKYTKTSDTAISIGSTTEYSTSEKVVGTWINGKPLYQKTVALTVPTYVAGTSDAQGERLNYITNIERASIDNVFISRCDYNCFENDAFLLGYGGTLDITLTSGGAFNELCRTWIGIDETNTYIRICVRNKIPSLNGQQVYVTLQYTKTSN